MMTAANQSVAHYSTQPGVRYLLRRRAYPRRISLVIPVYNEQESLGYLRSALDGFAKELGTADVEIVLVNDGSADDTIELLYDWASADPRIAVINLSRNFGHQIAATAGLDYATGDAVVLLDADLQDPLSVIHEMIDRYCEGYDVAYGRRVARTGEGVFKQATAWLFYRAMRLLIYKDLQVDTGDFRLISRPCLDALMTMRESHRFLRGMTTWVGYPQIAVEYVRNPRVAGSTKYPLKKMLRLALTAATSFSTLPLKISLYCGLAFALISFEELVRAIVAYFTGHAITGWASLMVAVTGIGGTLLIGVGVLGEYVGKLYEEAKGRPLYLVATTVNAERQRPANRE